MAGLLIGSISASLLSCSSSRKIQSGDGWSTPYQSWVGVQPTPFILHPKQSGLIDGKTTLTFDSLDSRDPHYAYLTVHPAAPARLFLREEDEKIITASYANPFDSTAQRYNIGCGLVQYKSADTSVWISVQRETFAWKFSSP